MRKKNKSSICTTVLLGVVLFLISSCTTKFHYENDGDGYDEENENVVEEVEEQIEIIDISIEEEELSWCGNGQVDEGEECDDGKNGNPDDGCKDNCTFSCHQNADCNNGNICDGEETCNTETHRCESGTPRQDCSICSPSPNLKICVNNNCVAPTCGDGCVTSEAGEYCEPPNEGGCDANCHYPCTSDTNCPPDTEICNGEEFCNTTTHLCDRRNLPAQGTECGTNPRQICIAQQCEVSRCGDGFTDSGATPAEECDDRNLDENDGCKNDCTYTCHIDGECDDNHDCTYDICDTSTHACSHNPMSMSGSVCRHSTGDCDIEETCNGISLDCPEDTFLSSGTECRASSGICGDQTEFCSGDSPLCPADDFPDRLLSGVSGVSTGLAHTCAVMSDGTAKCWGYNAYGQLGDNSTIEKSLPVNVTDLNNVSQIAAGYNFTCALLTSGGVECWGSNSYGQLGIESNDSARYEPVQVSGLDSGVLAITAGAFHACALLTSGEVKCWGFNRDGELGDGTTINKSSPVSVSGLSGVAAIEAGWYHTCAILSEGVGVKCWGSNGNGELGDGTTIQRTSPVDVVDGGGEHLSGVSGISGGASHTCALLSDGGVKCWGGNSFGQLGDMTNTGKFTPVDVYGLSSGVVKISAGRGHTCALLSTGGVKCWGHNAFGQVGDGTRTNSNAPVDVPGLSSGVSDISASLFMHTCAVLGTGNVKCWGYNDHGQLGDGIKNYRTTPVDVSDTTSRYLKVSAGYMHTCGLINSLTDPPKCWGDNGDLQIGDSDSDRYTGHKYSPVSVNDSSIYSEISSGGYHTCAIVASGSESGRVKCWGKNHVGQLGNGNNTDQSSPVFVSSVNNAVQVSAGLNHTCAVLATGTVKCWGWNNNGQLGNGTTNNSNVPVDVIGLINVVSIASGGNHTCALLNGGSVKCWGLNSSGQLGDGSMTQSSTPVDVSISNVSAITAGREHTCAIVGLVHSLMCWGDNNYGQLGNGLTDDASSPTPTGLASGVSQVSAGQYHTCALLSSGIVKCWGWNVWGQLGDGTTIDRSTPVDVSGLSGVSVISAGGFHSCAVLTGGSVKCWGYAHHGQLGDGIILMKLSPSDDWSYVCSN